MRVGTGVLLLAACAVVAGSPWTGSNFGAAITLFAAAGMWLGIRRRRPWWMIVVITGAITAVGMAAIAVMHRYLTDRPTHVTRVPRATRARSRRASTGSTGRLGIGFDQLTDTPLALIPVVGTLVLLVLVLRPPTAIARSFEGHDAWRDAVLVILLGSIVAYLAERHGRGGPRLRVRVRAVRPHRRVARHRPEDDGPMSAYVPPRPDVPSLEDMPAKATWRWWEALIAVLLAWLAGGLASLPLVVILEPGATGRSGARRSSSASCRTR